VTSTPVLATLVTTFQWSKDGKRIQTVLLPDDGKRERPKPASVPAEPKVRVARDGKDPSRTYRYLLESPFDARLLEYLVTGQLALTAVGDGTVTKIALPTMIRGVAMPPGEVQFRVTTVKKPFSYYVPFTRFGSLEGIWDADGKNLYTIADRNLRETEPPAPVVATQQPATRGGGQRGAMGKTGGQPPAHPGQPGEPPNPPPPRPH